MNETHSPSLRSWVSSANDPDSDFPIQNLPFGVFRPVGPEDDASGVPRVGVAIGDRVLDLEAAHRSGTIDCESLPRILGRDLSGFLELSPAERGELRTELSGFLREDGGRRPPADTEREILHPAESVRMLLPTRIGDYTDFYASVHHATNVGRLFRPDAPLLPNYKWIPIGYHGRASSIVIDGTGIRRPSGQLRPAEGSPPPFVPSRMLDYEVEVGAFLGGRENPLGTPIPLARAEERLAGLCLLNDWSARDLQAWEYQPLGPFLAKSFATTISPWIVTAEALEPFRVPPAPRPDGDPAPLPHLSDPGDAERGAIDLHLELSLRTSAMRRDGSPAVPLSIGNLRDLYWTFAQMIAHHSSNGCNLRPGDLFGSGTVSGEEERTRGSLLELTRRGDEPIRLPNGEIRTFLLDGDEVILRGWCEGEGRRRIGFGSCRGRILATK